MIRERPDAGYRLLLVVMTTALATVLLLGLATSPVLGTEPAEIAGDEIGDETRYAGERFNVTFTDEPFNQTETVYLFETGSDPGERNEWSFVEQYPNESDTEGEFLAEEVDTTGLDGYYVFANSTNPPDVDDPKQFFVLEEELEATWEEEVATGDDDDLQLEIDSSRRATDGGLSRVESAEDRARSESRLASASRPKLVSESDSNPQVGSDSRRFVVEPWLPHQYR